MIDKKWIGHELPASVLPIERSRLQFFAKAIGETDPVYTDAAAARDAGNADLPAPPTFLFAAELDSGAAFRLIEELQIPIAELLHGEHSFTLSRERLRGRHGCRSMKSSARSGHSPLAWLSAMPGDLYRQREGAVIDAENRRARRALP